MCFRTPREKILNFCCHTKAASRLLPFMDPFCSPCSAAHCDTGHKACLTCYPYISTGAEIRKKPKTTEETETKASRFSWHNVVNTLWLVTGSPQSTVALYILNQYTVVRSAPFPAAHMHSSLWEGRRRTRREHGKLDAVKWAWTETTQIAHFAFDLSKSNTARSYQWPPPAKIDAPTSGRAYIRHPAASWTGS